MKSQDKYSLPVRICLDPSKYMIIISNYILKINKAEEKYIVNLEEAPCPLCSGRLEFKDSLLRIVRWSEEDTEFITIRVLYCERCNKSHRELPDFLMPHKHYACKIIEAVIEDEDIRPVSESTARRWIKWFERIKAHLNGALLAAKSAFEKISLYALNPLEKLREAGRGWLSGVMRRYINSGGRISEIT